MTDMRELAKMIKQREKFKRDNQLLFAKLNKPQQKFMDAICDVRKDQLPRRLIYIGCNKAGKTTASVIRGICLALGEHPFLPEGHPLRVLKNWPTPNVGLVCGEQLTQSIDKKLVPEYLRWLPKICQADTKKNAQGVVTRITIRKDLKGDPLDSIVHFRCFDENTEVLSTRGWVKFKDLPADAMVMTMRLRDRVLEWQRPTGYYRAVFDGMMIGSNHATLDFLVTPDHRMVYDQAHSKKHKERVCKVTKAGLLRRRYAVPRRFRWEGESPDTVKVPMSNGRSRRNEAVWVDVKASDWVAFLGIFLAEGHIAGGQVKISQKKGTWRSVRIREMLSLLPYRAIPDRDGYAIGDVQLAKYLKPMTGSANKYIPQRVREMCPDLLKILLKWMFLGDGCIADKVKKLKNEGEKEEYRRDNWENIAVYDRYTTISKRLADDVQEVLLKVGLNASISEIDQSVYRKTKQKQYVVNIQTSKMVGYIPGKAVKGRKYVEEVLYNGEVFCVSVPNSTVMVRRNGKTLISGNSYDSEVSTFEGIDMNWVAWDEPPPYRHMVAAERGLLPSDGISFLTFTSLKEPWIKDFADRSIDMGGSDRGVRVIESGDIWQTSVENGGFLTKEAIEEFIKIVPKEEYDARVLGKWMNSGSVIYGSFRDEEPYVIPSFDIPRHWTRVESIDPHDAKPTRWLFCAVAPYDIDIDDEVLNRIFVVDYLNLHSSMTIYEMVQAVKRKRLDLAYSDKGPFSILLDAKYGRKRTVATATTDEPITWEEKLSDAGAGYIELSISKPGSVELGHKITRAYLRPQYFKVAERDMPGLIFFDRCRGIDGPIESMRKYRYKIGTDQPEEDFKDFCDCVRYVCLSKPRYVDPERGHQTFQPRDKYAGR